MFMDNLASCTLIGGHQVIPCITVVTLLAVVDGLGDNNEILRIDLSRGIIYNLSYALGPSCSSQVRFSDWYY